MKNIKNIIRLMICTAFALVLLSGINSFTASAHGSHHEGEHHTEYSHGTCCQSGSHVCDTIKVPDITKITNCSGGITVTWGECRNAGGYQLYRKCGSGSYTRIATVKTGCSYKDTDVKRGKTYSYKVRVYESCTNGKAYSKCSSNKKMHHMSCPTISDCRSISTGVKLCWNKPSGITGFKIYRKCSGEASYKRVKTTSSCKWTDKTAEKGKKYYYKIRCYYKTSSGKIYYSTYCPSKCIKYN